MNKIEVGIIGGSGLYDLEGLTDVKEVQVDTPFGKPSDAIILGTLHGRRIAFLPRHGSGHTLSPTEVPYKANIYALKVIGVKYIFSISACGSLREDFAPGHVVIPNQLVDFTKHRETSYFSGGIVSHVSVAQPFSPELGKALENSVYASGGTVHRGGSIITIEGPRFSTLGESNLYRQWGMSIIGMTTSPEAFLAAEAEIAYTIMAHVTDYDVWHESEEPVTVEKVIGVLQKNTNLAKSAINHLIEHMDTWEGDFPAHHTLKDSIITDPKRFPKAILDTLAPILGKYLGK